jgi:hypothetical protein
MRSKRRNEERDEMTKKYVTQDEKETQEYERGFRNGWTAAKDKFLAEGIDVGLRQAAKEKEEEEDKEERWGEEKGIVGEDESK